MLKRVTSLLIFSASLSPAFSYAAQPTTLTQAQLTESLVDVESRLSKKVEHQCANWQTLQQTQLQKLGELKQAQHDVTAKLRELDNKLDKLSQHSPQAPLANTTEQQATACPTLPANPIGDKLLVGQEVWILIKAVNTVYSARVDTGAATSSISALDITPFEKDGNSWVRFRVVNDADDEGIEVEAPLVRHAHISQASAEEIDKRPVVKLAIQIGNFSEDAEFTLNDRTAMTYPVLLGREFLKDVAVVDVGKKNVHDKPEVAPETLEADAEGETNSDNSEPQE